MVRAVLFAAMLCAAAAPLAAQGMYMNLDVIDAAPQDDRRGLRGHLGGRTGPLYGGVRASTVAQADHGAEYAVYVGVAPKVGRLDVDMRLTQRGTDEGSRGGAVALAVTRPLGQAVAVAAGLGYDAGADRTRAETRATLRLRRTTLGAGVQRSFDGAAFARQARLAFDVGVARRSDTAGTLDLRYRDPVAAGGRAEFTWALRF